MAPQSRAQTSAELETGARNNPQATAYAGAKSKQAGNCDTFIILRVLIMC